LITSNAFYVVLTPSIHGDFIAWRLCGTEKIKDVEVRGGILQGLHEMMYMSINHGEIINDFKEHGKVIVRKSFHKQKSGDAWTNYF
jgi:hypothetical protein